MSVDDKEEILHILKSFGLAVENGDYKSVLENTIEDFNGFGTNVDEIFINQNELITDLDKQSNQQKEDNIKIKFEFDKNIVSFINEGSAFVMNYGHTVYTYPEGEIILDRRTTFILKKINNKWKVCHFHLSKPFSGSEVGIPIPKFEQISENISNWLKRLEIDKFD